MDYQVNFKLNSTLFLKDPLSSDLGSMILKHSIELIYELGFEHFTFKKLATEISTTEATIYRYFENKQKLLLYILNWYWSYMEFTLMLKLQNVQDAKEKIKIIIDCLTEELNIGPTGPGYNKQALHHLIVVESSKSYLLKEVSEINKDEVFKPYKDLCARIADIVKEYNPKYKFPRSFSSTLIETSHQQNFFSQKLPRLTDVDKKNKEEYVKTFIQDLVFKALQD